MNTSPLFRTAAPAEAKPESPVLMFRDLKRHESVKFLWGHQEKTLDAYFASYRDANDIAIELPTGTGKTLVGLLIAEYRRRALEERVAFLCSTRQLCAQVGRLAKNYGIPTSLLVGPQADYDQQKFAQYQQGRSITLTTYSSIFNSNLRISDPHVLICDDAHSADGFVSSMWTVRVSRYDDQDAFLAIVKFLKATLPENLVHRMLHFEPSPLTRTAVDLISVMSFYDRIPEFRRLMEGLVEDTDHVYAWRAVSQHLPACSLYCSPDTIELRPVLSPTRTHAPFADARQRVYMSATLSDDGDIERSFGVKEIKKLPVSEGWDRRGTGRRLMLFPGLASSLETKAEAIPKLIGVGEKSLVLVPDNRTRDLFKEQLQAHFTVLLSADTEQEIEKFRKAAPPIVLILANRYDGIDFPGPDCRNLVVFGLPTGSSLQEAYLVYRLNATSQLRDRIRTRVSQAVGRCTRDENDYAVVIIDGKDLLKWFCTRENTAGMHPELQAEIAFGLENSEGRDTAGLIALSEALLKQTTDWEPAEADLKSRRNSATKRKDSSAEALAKAAPFEIEYMYNLWEGNYEQAYKHADRVLQFIAGDEVRPYRAFWGHQAAVAAFLTWKQRNDDQFKQTALRRLEEAAKNRIAINWIGDLVSRVSGSAPSIEERLPVQEWFNTLNDVLEDFGIIGKKSERRLAELRRFIASTTPKQFHQGLEWLGKMLGANSKQWKSSGAPDGCWQFGNWFATVFEAKTEEFTVGHISLKTVRQAGTHARTAKGDHTIPHSTPTQTVIVSPRKSVASDAVMHAADMSHMSHEAVIEIFDKAAAAIEQLRLAAPDVEGQQLREKAIEIYKKHGVFMTDVRDFLTSCRLDSLPVGK